jgi:hypothetical protein
MYLIFSSQHQLEILLTPILNVMQVHVSSMFVDDYPILIS